MDEDYGKDFDKFVAEGIAHPPKEDCGQEGEVRKRLRALTELTIEWEEVNE